jgi:thiamine biosynthesis protein ThiI
MAVTEDAVDIPVFRPCIGMDKEDIVEISRKMGAFETSIEPYDDCCAMFSPRHPKLNPKLEDVLEAEAKLDIEGLVERCAETAERVRF